LSQLRNFSVQDLVLTITT